MVGFVLYTMVFQNAQVNYMFNGKNLTVALCKKEDKNNYLNGAIPVFQAVLSKRLSLTVIVVESQICTKVFLKSLISVFRTRI